MTAAGRDAAQIRLAELLHSPAEEFPLFGTGLAFVNLLSESEVVRLLRSRAVLLEANLAGHQTAHDALLKQGLERYKLLDHEWTIARVRGELDYDINRRAEAEIQGLARNLNLLGERLADVEELLRERLSRRMEGDVRGTTP